METEEIIQVSLTKKDLKVLKTIMVEIEASHCKTMVMDVSIPKRQTNDKRLQTLYKILGYEKI